MTAFFLAEWLRAFKLSPHFIIILLSSAVRGRAMRDIYAKASRSRATLSRMADAQLPVEIQALRPTEAANGA